MDTMVIIFAGIFIIGFPTLAILSCIQNISSTKFMLLGIEVTIIGAIFVSCFSNNNFVFYCLGLALFIIGFTFSIFGFSKKN